MGSVQRVGDLEIDQDLSFQRGQWKAQRIGGAVMILVLILTATGFFGDGPLSSTSAGDPDSPISVSYQRFVRYDGPSTFTVTIDSDQASDGQVSFWVNAGYIKHFKIERIMPQPEAEQIGNERITYVFSVDEPTAPIEVSFTVRSDQIGRLSGRAGLPDGTELTFSQFSYP